jgi:hypothetical protein
VGARPPGRHRGRPLQTDYETGLHISVLDHVCLDTTAVLPRDSCLVQATANRNKWPWVQPVCH